MERPPKRTPEHTKDFVRETKPRSTVSIAAALGRSAVDGAQRAKDKGTARARKVGRAAVRGARKGR